MRKAGIIAPVRALGSWLANSKSSYDMLQAITDLGAGSRKIGALLFRIRPGANLRCVEVFIVRSWPSILRFGGKG